MIVDVHTRIWETPQQLGPAAAAYFLRRTDPINPLDASPLAHEQAMQPIRFAVIHGLVSRLAGASLDGRKVAEYVKLQPSRNLGSASIDPMSPGYLEQIDQARQLNVMGLTISPGFQGFHPAHTKAMRLYEKAQDARLAVFVHPFSQLAPAANLGFDQPQLFDEVAAAFPNLRLIIAQAGYPWVEPLLVLLQKHQLVYADLSHLILRPWLLYNTLVSAYQLGVMDRLLLASGFPATTPQKAITTLYSINSFAQGHNLPAVPREQLRMIVEQNAARCLGLPEDAAGGPNSGLNYDIHVEQDSIVPPPTTFPPFSSSSSRRG
ncbi:MAG: amidohydrolase family protein [Phycisphaeraceae bacterium]|nr:amidohydrolase family protein [Phycisphaeraceae bacterium]